MLLSICEQYGKLATYFHFIGAFNGHYIKRVRVVSNYQFKKNEVYKILGEVVGVQDGVLTLKELKVQHVDI